MVKKKQTYYEKRAGKTRKKRRIFRGILLILVAVAAVLGGFWGLRHTAWGVQVENTLWRISLPDWIETALIPVDGDSRRGEFLESANDIVIHYVGNPGTSAMANRNWYADSQSTVSSHFIVGLEGEVLLCVPLNEKSSASNDRNKDTISIETCHPDETGQFSEVTYESLVRLTAWLCQKYNLGTDHIIRHYDVTGKICPKYFVENEAAWEQFKADVAALLQAGTVS